MFQVRRKIRLEVTKRVSSQIKISKVGEDIETRGIAEAISRKIDRLQLSQVLDRVGDEKKLVRTERYRRERLRKESEDLLRKHCHLIFIDQEDLQGRKAAYLTW